MAQIINEETRRILDEYWRTQCDNDKGKSYKCTGCPNLNCTNSYGEIVRCMKRINQTLPKDS